MISEEYSKECDEIFGLSIGCKDFLEVIGSFADEDSVSMMRNVFERIFRDLDKARNKAYLSLLPREIKISEKYIQIDYKVIPNQAEKSVMLILTDITDKKELELKNAEEKSNIELVIRAIGSKSEIIEAIEGLREFVEQRAQQLLISTPTPKAALQQFFRIIHTMKGDFSLNSLHHTAAGLHQLEDSLGLMLKNVEAVSFDKIHEFVLQMRCEQLLQHDISIIQDALGAQYFEKDDIYTVSSHRLGEIKNKVADRRSRD